MSAVHQEGSGVNSKTLNVATKTFDLMPWMRHRTDEHSSMWEPSPDAPHKRVDHLEWGDPINQFGVVWADEQHTIPIRVIDGDGCTAVILKES
jgi:hypothetical protein